MEGGQCSLCHRTQAKYACSCAFPAISICAACLAVHLDTKGEHMAAPIKKQTAGSMQMEAYEVCDECRAGQLSISASAAFLCVGFVTVLFTLTEIRLVGSVSPQQQISLFKSQHSLISPPAVLG